MIHREYRDRADALYYSLMHQIYPFCLVNNKDCDGKPEIHHLLGKRLVQCRRHDPLCAVKACSWHHRLDPVMAPHANPKGFEIFMQEKYPLRWEWMEANKWASDPVDFKEAYETLKELKQEIRYDRSKTHGN